jgi:hypothetical protein
MHCGYVAKTLQGRGAQQSSGKTQDVSFVENVGLLNRWSNREIKKMSDIKTWRHTNRRTFRLSDALLAMALQECKVKNIKFSAFLRSAILGALRHGRYEASAR